MSPPLDELTGAWLLQSCCSHGGNALYQERPEGATRTLWRKINQFWSNKIGGGLTQRLGDWVIETIHSHHQRHFSYWAHNYL